MTSPSSLRPLALLAVALSLLIGVPPAGSAAPVRILTGDLLVASPEMRDPRFAQTVIYMIRHDAHGAQGLVINRPLGEVPLARLLERLGMESAGAQGLLRLHNGRTRGGATRDRPAHRRLHERRHHCREERHLGDRRARDPSRDRRWQGPSADAVRAGLRRLGTRPARSGDPGGGVDRRERRRGPALRPGLREEVEARTGATEDRPVARGRRRRERRGEPLSRMRTDGVERRYRECGRDGAGFAVQDDRSGRVLSGPGGRLGAPAVAGTGATAPAGAGIRASPAVAGPATAAGGGTTSPGCAGSDGAAARARCEASETFMTSEVLV